MKLMTFKAEGRPSYGAVVGEEVVDLAARTPFASLQALIAADGLATAQAALDKPGPRYPLAAVEFLGPLPEARLFCVGANYPKPHPLGGVVSGPANVSFFIKHHEALVPHGAAVEKPTASPQFDYECELAIVIDKGGRSIPEAEALKHVFGYTILNDGSVRDWQKHSVCAGKNFYKSGSWGPWIATADETGDPAGLHLTTTVNGVKVQDSGIGKMFFSVPVIIAYISTLTPLLPGDVIATGSPEGTGSTLNPPRYLQSGDKMEFAISKIGVLRNSVG
jgi:2-keto-4-pentenoate hydratase/2-oxohepta-3-ene-1,7-dioic acid hydratase in catechol pathway